MPFFHIRIRYAKVAHDASQFLQKRLRFFWLAKIRPRDNFDQRRSRAIEVHQCLAVSMDVLGGVFLQMRTLNTNLNITMLTAWDFYAQTALTAHGDVKLRNLISLW